MRALNLDSAVESLQTELDCNQVLSGMFYISADPESKKIVVFLDSRIFEQGRYLVPKMWHIYSLEVTTYIK